MPELPEVETIKRGLEKKIVGKIIKQVEVRLAKMINGPESWFKKHVEGTKIKKVERRAKNLFFTLSNSQWLVFHLKLTGQLIFVKKGKEEGKYTHLIFYFTDRTKLLFNDLRQFGYVKLFDQKKWDSFLKAMRFGPEPLEKDFTLAKFEELLNKKKKQKIKPLLMDQSFIAGVGNVYAQEACFYAKIKPTRKVGSLKEKEIKELYQGLIKILKEAIAYRGTSVDAYVDAGGEKGDYEKKLKVYGRTGKKCARCGGVVKTIKLAGRGTSFCPQCQK